MNNQSTYRRSILRPQNKSGGYTSSDAEIYFEFSKNQNIDLSSIKIIMDIQSSAAATTLPECGVSAVFSQFTFELSGSSVERINHYNRLLDSEIHRNGNSSTINNRLGYSSRFGSGITMATTSGTYHEAFIVSGMLNKGFILNTNDFQSVRIRLALDSDANSLYHAAAATYTINDVFLEYSNMAITPKKLPTSFFIKSYTGTQFPNATSINEQITTYVDSGLSLIFNVNQIINDVTSTSKFTSDIQNLDSYRSFISGNYTSDFNIGSQWGLSEIYQDSYNAIKHSQANLITNNFITYSDFSGANAEGFLATSLRPFKSYNEGKKIKRYNVINGTPIRTGSRLEINQSSITATSQVFLFVEHLIQVDIVGQNVQYRNENFTITKDV